jgi:hypothetical protein
MAPSAMVSAVTIVNSREVNESSVGTIIKVIILLKYFLQNRETSASMKRHRILPRRDEVTPWRRHHVM